MHLTCKACVCFFSFSFTKWQPIKIMKNAHAHEKFLGYSSFLHFLIPFLSPVSHCSRSLSKLNLKVYDVINFLKRYLKTNFVRYLEKGKRPDVEILLFDTVRGEYRSFLRSVTTFGWTKIATQTLILLILFNSR